MKQLLILFSLLTSSLAAQQITDFGDGNRLYVWAESGLVLRVSNSLESEKLLTIPYGATVEMISNSNAGLRLPYLKELAGEVELYSHAYSLDNYFLEVRYNGKTGYAFGGFLLRYPPPATPEEQDQGIFIWLSNILGEPDTMMKKRGEYSGEYGVFATESLVSFDCGATIFEENGSVYHGYEVTLPLADLNDGLIIANAFYDLEKGINEPEQGTFDDNFHLQEVEATRLYFFADGVQELLIRVIGHQVVISYFVSC